MRNKRPWSQFLLCEINTGIQNYHFVVELLHFYFRLWLWFQIRTKIIGMLLSLLFVRNKTPWSHFLLREINTGIQNYHFVVEPLHFYFCLWLWFRIPRKIIGMLLSLLCETRDHDLIFSWAKLILVFKITTLLLNFCISIYYSYLLFIWKWREIYSRRG